MPRGQLGLVRVFARTGARPLMLSLLRFRPSPAAAAVLRMSNRRATPAASAVAAPNWERYRAKELPRRATRGAATQSRSASPAAGTAAAGGAGSGNTPTKSPGRGKQAVRRKRVEVAYEDAGDGDVDSAASSAAQGAQRRRKRRAAAPGSTAARVGADDAEGRAGAGAGGGNRSKGGATGGSGGAAPEGWEQQYANIEKMRANRDAVVDTMGAEALPDRSDPRVFRYQTLVSLMLSSQTKVRAVQRCSARIARGSQLFALLASRTK